MIEWLGPVDGYSSETYESWHKLLRHLGENSNYLPKDHKMMEEVGFISCQDPSETQAPHFVSLVKSKMSQVLLPEKYVRLFSQSLSKFKLPQQTLDNRIRTSTAIWIPNLDGSKSKVTRGHVLEFSEEPTKVFVRVEDIFEFEEMNPQIWILVTSLVESIKDHDGPTILTPEAKNRLHFLPTNFKGCTLSLALRVLLVDNEIYLLPK